MMKWEEALAVVKPSPSKRVFVSLLLHVLSKLSVLSAPQAVQCEVWVREGGEYV